MTWFNDLRTRVKLAACFGALAALVAVVGLVGLSAAGDANASLVIAYGRDMKSVDLARQAAAERLRVARSYREGFLARDDAGRASAIRELDGEERQFAAILPALRATLSARESLEVIDHAASEIAHYIGRARDGVRLSATDREGGMALIDHPAGNRITAALDKLVEDTGRIATASEEKSARQYERGRAFVLGMTSVAVLFALLCIVVAGRAIADPLAAAAEVLGRVGRGDLSAHLDVQRKDEIGDMAVALNAAVDALRGTLLGVRDVSSDVSSSAAELAASSDAISRGAQEQAASLEETAASLHQVSATAKQSADTADAAAALVTGTRDAAERGGSVVKSAVAAMTEITTSSRRIGDIIASIDEIAFQTNLLALNAAVEAARAGDLGRGFAVVASEVRSLAQRTVSAAREIRGLIGDATAKVEVGTSEVNRSGETLRQIVEGVQRVSGMVVEMAASSREQLTGVNQINVAVVEVDHVTQANAAQTEELSATAVSLADKARHLETLVASFELGAGTSPAARAAHASPLARTRANVRPGRVAAVQEPTFRRAAGGYEEL